MSDDQDRRSREAVDNIERILGQPASKSASRAPTPRACQPELPDDVWYGGPSGLLLILIAWFALAFIAWLLGWI